MGEEPRFAGVDLGSSYTKAVVIGRDKKIISSCVLKTGADFEDVSRRALAGVLNGVEPRLRVISTGVGRSRCPSAEQSRTEITCLTRAGFHLVGRAHTIVDIGGQDNKIITVGGDGTQLNFKMNRKCAAGTGAFLEEVAGRLDIPAGEMSALAGEAERAVAIGSYCTVFTCTEIIHHIREGKKPPGILKGCYESVVDRILEMDPLEGEVVLTGGVIANHPVVADIFREKLGRAPVAVSQPQFAGALGAALLSLENYE